MTGLVWLLLSGPAAAADCPQRISARDFRGRLAALAPYVKTGDPDPIRDSLGALEELALGCVDGPLFAADMGGLYLAQAAVELLHQGAPERANERLSWAAALNTPSALADEYGADVVSSYESARSASPGQGTLEIWIDPQPSVMVLDGQVEYQDGPRKVAAGAHLVQWLGADGWDAERAVVEPDGTAAVGERPAEPVVAAVEEPEEPNAARPERARRERAPKEPKPPKEPRAREPREPREPREARVREPRVREPRGGGATIGASPSGDARWRFAASVGASGYAARVSDGSQLWQATAASPTGALGVERMLGDVVWLGLDARGALPSSGERPDPLTRAGALAGVRLGEDTPISLGLGAVAAPLPAVSGVGPPAFEAALTFGPRGAARVEAGDALKIGVDLGGAWMASALDLTGGLSVGRPSGALTPALSLRGGQLTAPGLADQVDRYRWAGLEFGVVATR